MVVKKKRKIKTSKPQYRLPPVKADLCFGCPFRIYVKGKIHCAYFIENVKRLPGMECQRLTDCIQLEKHLSVPSRHKEKYWEEEIFKHWVMGK